MTVYECGREETEQCVSAVFPWEQYLYYFSMAQFQEALFINYVFALNEIKTKWVYVQHLTG